MADSGGGNAGPWKIELYFDCLSPFSYLAFTVLTRYEELWGIELELKPFLLGGVMAATGNTPPGARPWAGATMRVSAQDMERTKRHFNMPSMLDMPGNFFGPDGPADKRGLARDLRYMRTLAALRRLHPATAGGDAGRGAAVLRDGARGVFEHIWADADARDGAGNVAMSEAALQDILVRNTALGVAEAAEVVAAHNAPETKAALKATVAEAVERGAYGAPFIVLRRRQQREGEDEEHVFFGSDRFEQLAFVAGLPWLGPDPKRPSVAKL